MGMDLFEEFNAIIHIYAHLVEPLLSSSMDQLMHGAEEKADQPHKPIVHATRTIQAVMPQPRTTQYVELPSPLLPR